MCIETWSSFRFAFRLCCFIRVPLDPLMCTVRPSPVCGARHCSHLHTELVSPLNRNEGFLVRKMSNLVNHLLLDNLWVSNNLGLALLGTRISISTHLEAWCISSACELAFPAGDEYGILGSHAGLVIHFATEYVVCR
jgi:hypothetical protein